MALLLGQPVDRIGLRHSGADRQRREERVIAKSPRKPSKRKAPPARKPRPQAAPKAKPKRRKIGAIERPLPPQSAVDAKIAATLAALRKTLDDDKAEDIVSLDLRGLTSIADHMLVASGRSQRHVGAIAEHLAQRAKDATGRAPRVEGLPQCDWVLIDTGDIIVHVFRPEVRAHYSLEKMWSRDLAEPRRG
jgi:ribosome-associated protein